MKKLLHIFQGNDGEYSLRRIMSVVVLFGLIKHVETCPDNEGVAMVLASLIAALLALTTWQNVKSKDNE